MTEKTKIKFIATIVKRLNGIDEYFFQCHMHLIVGDVIVINDGLLGVVASETLSATFGYLSNPTM